MGYRKSSPKYANRKKEPSLEPKTPMTETRAKYVLDLIDDSPWLDGRWTKLVGMVKQHFGIQKGAAEAAVTRAYELLSLAHKQDGTAQKTAEYLRRIHLKTIEKGFRDDPRLITAAAKALAQLVGAELQPTTGVTVAGGNVTISADSVRLLEGMKLTNAQRMARIEELDRKLSEPAPVESSPGDDLPVQKGD